MRGTFVIESKRDVTLLKIAKDVINAWSCQIAGESKPPVMFSDELAYAFFVDAVSLAMRHAYKFGRRDEAKLRKIRAARRYKKIRESKRGSTRQ